jgi:hypothetical protein
MAFRSVEEIIFFLIFIAKVRGKATVNLSLCLTNHYAMETCGRVNIYMQIHVFFTSALAEGEWSTSRPVALSPGHSLQYPFHWSRDNS